VAALQAAEQVCSVQYLSGTRQMPGQPLGPDHPGIGTSTFPTNTKISHGLKQECIKLKITFSEEFVIKMCL
jgi:hypothetical protein